MGSTLTTAEARRFYDRLGAWQDTQAFYEDRVLEVLVRHGDFGRARSVFEFGCGTGRLAERLLAGALPADCRYRGVDLSTTMVELARARLRGWAPRAEVVLGDGGVPGAEGRHDRFVSTYVLDLLSEDAIVAVLAGAHRLLEPDGLLGVVGLTHGAGPVSKAVTGAWTALHRLSPVLVGGCRPLALGAHLEPARWRLERRELVSAWGITSEVVVARRVGTA